MNQGATRKFRLLGDLVRFEGGGTPSRSIPEYWNGNVPWATVKDCRDITLTETQEYITPSGLQNSASRLVPAGTLIIPTRMALGKAVITAIDVAINQDLRAVYPADDLDHRYLLWFFLSNAHRIEAMGSGATVKGITQDKLRSLEIPVPSLPEQAHIAAILDKADDMRRKRQESLRLIEEFLRSVFLDMFGDLSAHGWKLETVEQLLASEEGAIRTGPFGSQLLHNEFVDSGVNVLGIDNVVYNRFQWAQRRFITVEKYQRLRRYTVHPGDVLITIMGTCGRCAVVPDDVPTAINTKHLCCITLGRVHN